MSAPLVLSFDLDDTLWPVAPVIAGAENVLFSWLRERYPRTVQEHDLDSLRDLRSAVGNRHPDRSHDLTFLRHRTLKDLFAAAGHEESLADEALEVFFTERNKVKFYADAIPALRRLRSCYRLFALSNGNADLKRCGVDDLFDGHITAVAAGAAKPDARIFAALAARAGVAPAQVLHIGDDPLADVVGAMQAGMQAVWLNRESRPWPAQYPPPPRSIASLDELS